MDSEWINMRTLIVYGTRYGATEGNAEEIAKVLRANSFDVKVVDAKKEKIKDISDFELVIVGSGMRMFRWVKEPENFIKKFQKELQQKHIAIFVSSGAQLLHEFDGEKQAMEDAWQKYLVDKTAKYHLETISMAIFGGVWDYDKMGFFFKRTMEPMKEKLIEAGFTESSPGVYDSRNWDKIREWTTDLIQKLEYK
jgi:menaquinone-dependent protoporphyrinogen oxidase